MFNFIKGLVNKKELIKIKELENVVISQKEKIMSLETELENLSEQSAELEMHLHMAEQPEEVESESELCSCGGCMIPMYEEYPQWIQLCTVCEKRTENTDASPIQEPA